MGQEIHSLGVKLFFLLGGYFITISWNSEKKISRYLIKRFFRIWPPLVIAVFVTAFIICPLFSSLEIGEYLKNPEVMNYFIKNIKLYPVYALPGVFIENPYKGAVNGSLWSLPVEMLMYIIVPLFSTFVIRRERKRDFFAMLIITVMICALQILHLVYFPEKRIIIYGTDLMQALDLFPWYLIGMLFTFPYIKKCLNLQIAMLLYMLCACMQFLTVFNYIMVYIFFPYVIFSFGLSNSPFFGKKIPSRRWEISYGLFLYGFPIQQAVEWINLKNNMQFSFMTELTMSVFITSVFAYISHNFVEEKSSNICNVILQKIE